MAKTIGELASERAEETRKKIKKTIEDNIGITVREICQIVGLEGNAVRRHIKKIREEWKK